jgi:hypothetical protein
MPLNLRQATQLCTKSELELVTLAAAKDLSDLPAKRLQVQITRARGLRNKFRDLAARQAREARQKAPARRKRPARSNARTLQKAKLFGDVLKRFEAVAARTQEPAEEAAKTGDRGSARPAAGRSPVRAVRSRPARRARSAKRSAAPRSVEPRDSRALRESRALRRKSVAATGTRKGGQIARSPAARGRAHSGARDWRSQARRDSR